MSSHLVEIDGKYPWGGQAQAWTFVSGKIAGENAAKMASERKIR